MNTGKSGECNDLKKWEERAIAPEPPSNAAIHHPNTDIYDERENRRKIRSIEGKRMTN